MWVLLIFMESYWNIHFDYLLNECRKWIRVNSNGFVTTCESQVEPHVGLWAVDGPMLYVLMDALAQKYL